MCTLEVQSCGDLYQPHFLHAFIKLRDKLRHWDPKGLRKELFMDEDKEAALGFASLFNVLRSIKVTPERIAQNQWKSVNKNGEVEFYY